MTPTREPTLSSRSSKAFRAYLKIQLASCYILIPFLLVLAVVSGDDWGIALVGEVMLLKAVVALRSTIRKVR
jgi:hypothetical protein